MESPDPHGHPRGGSVTVRPDSALASPGDVDCGLSGSVLRDASEIQPSLEFPGFSGDLDFFLHEPPQTARG